MSEETKVDVWAITPHKNSSFDRCIIPVSDDPDGRKAMEYAQEVLELQWDATDLDITVLQVTMEKTEMCPHDWEESE